MSCEKEIPQIQEQLTETTVQDYRVMKLAYYRDMPETDLIGFRFYESPRIITISKTDSHLQQVLALMDASQKENTPIRIQMNEYAQLLTCEVASDEEADAYLSAKTYYPKPEFYKTTLPNMSKFQEIFDYMAAQGCATGTAEIDYCIPFQYVVDGCYARAHKMKQILNEKYGFSCQKVFSYEGPSGYLAVDAGECCVYWWYHVAPLVKVKTLDGIKQYVMDPSMFDHPVTIDEWTGAQENLDCSPYANFGYSEITPGYIYSPGGGTDPDYSSTNWTLYYYADLETCD